MILIGIMLTAPLIAKQERDQEPGERISMVTDCRYWYDTRIVLKGPSSHAHMYYFKTIIIDGIALTCPRGGCNDPGTFATHSCHMYTQESPTQDVCVCAEAVL